jgi:uncharacterized membrane protein YkoI
VHKSSTTGIAGLLGLLALVVASRADEEKVPLDKVPAAVMKAVKQKFPKAKIEEATKEVEDGKTIYEIEIEHANQDITVSLKDDGTIVEIEKEIAAKDMPAAVTRALKAKYPQGALRKVEEVTVGEKVTFEVVVAQDGKKPREVVLDRSGTIVEDEEKKAGDD